MVTGGTRQILRVEGLALLAAGVFAFTYTGQSWWLFAALFLVPDISFAAYAFGPRIGAALYNLLHSTTLPLALAVAAIVGENALVLAIATIWLAHIGFDRTLGYSLKYATSFHDTHLGNIGRNKK